MLKINNKLITVLTVAIFLAIIAPTSLAHAPGGGGCPSINALGNFVSSPDLGASFTDDLLGSATYDFTSTNESPSGGIPGLIEYCVYPSQPPGNPNSAAASYASWDESFGAIQGFFAFGRTGGNPNNIPFDGSTQTVGTATWNSVSVPSDQTILLHINDAPECDALYGGNPGTCFVFPGLVITPPASLCNDNPACKQVVIDEAITTTPLTVPVKTKLHIHYTYVIVNQPTNTFNMIFYPPTSKTLDINSGGGKDYFGCEQIPDPSGAPGAAGTFNTYQATGFILKYTLGKGTCDQSRFTLTAPTTITLTPGQSVSFTIDEITRVNKGKNQEYTSCGLHFLNSGFTVKWFQNNDGLLHSFSTNLTPLSVNAVGCP